MYRLFPKNPYLHSGAGYDFQSANYPVAANKPVFFRITPCDNMLDRTDAQELYPTYINRTLLTKRQDLVMKYKMPKNSKNLGSYILITISNAWVSTRDLKSHREGRPFAEFGIQNNKNPII